MASARQEEDQKILDQVESARPSFLAEGNFTTGVGLITSPRKKRLFAAS
mgnify:CR=1 FL=1